MKKKLGFLAVFAVASAVFFTTSNVDQFADVDLASLASLNKANAECVTIQGWPEFNNGECSWDNTCWIGGARPDCVYGY